MSATSSRDGRPVIHHPPCWTGIAEDEQEVQILRGPACRWLPRPNAGSVSDEEVPFEAVAEVHGAQHGVIDRLGYSDGPASPAPPPAGRVSHPVVSPSASMIAYPCGDSCSMAGRFACRVPKPPVSRADQALARAAPAPDGPSVGGDPGRRAGRVGPGGETTAAQAAVSVCPAIPSRGTHVRRRRGRHSAASDRQRAVCVDSPRPNAWSRPALR